MTEPTIESFQTLIENYESALQNITQDINEVQVEQKGIKTLFEENAELREQLESILALNSNYQTYNDNNQQVNHYRELIDNLKQQLQLAISEKENAIELWQNATKTIDYLEDELRNYQTSAHPFQNLVPKRQLLEAKQSYEARINTLEVNLSTTRQKLEDVTNLRSNDNITKKSIDEAGDEGGDRNMYKLIKRLEDEIYALKEQLFHAEQFKSRFEGANRTREEEIDKLKLKTSECRTKVEEALYIVDAALSEKDAALLRETQTKEELKKLNARFSEAAEANDEKVKAAVNKTKNEYQDRIRRLETEIHTNEERLKIRSLELENIMLKCQTLENEVDQYRKTRCITGLEEGASKFLSLEKNLEGTFQKLLISERQNIQLKSEKENIKSDLDQMAEHYSRDIKARDLEKIGLKSEIKKLKIDLDESYNKLTECQQKLADFLDQHKMVEEILKKDKTETKTQLEAKMHDMQKMRIAHRELIEELNDQLKAQVAINKRWRMETKTITNKLEHRINESKMEVNKIKIENRMLIEKLNDSNLKIIEYKKFLEIISKDVTKITSITNFVQDENNK